MPVYFYVSAGAGTDAARGALAFTREDRFKAVPGYQVMATHFHSALVGRLRKMHHGDLDVRLARPRRREGGRDQHLRAD